MKCHSMIYRTSIALGLVLLTGLAQGENNDSGKLDVFDLLSDEWADNRDYTCSDNPHIITFWRDRTLATFTYVDPPDRSHWSPSYHAYHRSPEKNRVKPQAWKISLIKDDTNYRWHLYGCPAWG